MKLPLLTLTLILIGCTQNKNETSEKMNWEKLNPTAEKLYHKAEAFEKKGVLDSASIYFYKADDKQPHHPLILQKISLQASKSNYLGTALIKLNESIRLTKDDQLKKWRYGERGTVYYKMGELERAFKDWRKAEEYGKENIEKYCSGLTKTSDAKLPFYYTYAESSRSSSLFDFKFTENSFDTDGRILKGKHIIFTQKPKEGPFYKLIANSKLILVPVDSNFHINRINNTTFDLFIPRNYSKNMVSYDVYIAPNPGYYLVTYFSNKIIGYPDTLHLSQQNRIVSNDK